MIRKIGLLIGVAALGALVTSCGGDDTPTPTPTDSGTPTPTATPTPVVFDFTSDFETIAGNTSAIYAYFTPTGGTEFFSDLARINGNSQISYVSSPNTVSVVFPELADPVAFDASHLTSSSAMERTYVNGDENLLVELPFQHVLRVTYELGNQAFTRDTVDGTLRSRRVTAFFATSDDDSDITTNLTYTGTPQVVGGELGVTAPDVISAPQVTFTITPGTNDTFTGTINIFEDVNGTPTQVAALDFSATVSANNTFTGTLEDTTFNLDGTFAGALAGDNRDELFLVFAASNDDDTVKFYGNVIGD